jgi:ATP-binding cassette, subfamily B, bacterial PglK
MKKNILKDFFTLLSFLKKKTKVRIYFSVFLMTIASMLEVISIGSLIPFVTVIFSPEKLMDIKFLNNFSDTKIFDKDNFKLLFTILFIFLVSISNLFKVFVLKKIIKLSKTIPIDISLQIYKQLIETDYNTFKKKNSAQFVSLVTDKMDSISGVFFNFLNGCTSLIIIIGILVLLLIVDTKISLLIILLVVIIYFLIGFFVKKKLKINSKILSKSSFARIKHVKETYGTIKQLILFNAGNIFFEIFKKQDKDYRIAQYKSQFIITFPRFLVETVGIITLATIIYFLSTNLDYEPITIISLVAILAFSAQRALPQINSIYISFTSLLNYSEFIKEINLILNEIVIKKDFQYKQEINDKDFEFKSLIKLKNISFKYDRNNSEIIKSLDFEIKKGTSVAIIGETGSGKTTLLDIIMGLLIPIQGKLEVDDHKINHQNMKNWQNKISHVPQETFLFDNTIKNNIIFNFENDKIDLSKVIEAAKLAEVHDFIETLPNKYETIVGEDGVFLSGGQKQRIGIARALFKNREILTLDESTSALDTLTEKKILNNLNKKNITIIQITHRINEVENYDNVIRL